MSIIAAGTTTTTALSSTGNTDGTLQLQVNGTTPSVTLNTLGAIGVGSTPSYGTAGQVLTSNGSTSAAYWSSVSGSSQWTTSGSNIYYTTGSVGVGTNSPAVSFEVNKSSGEALRVAATGANQSIYSRFIGGSPNTANMYVGVDSAAGGITGNGASGMMWQVGNAGLSFGTNNALRATIDSSGKVIIGGATPLGTFNLVGLSRPSGPVTYTSAASSANAQSGLNWYQDNNINYEYYLDLFATATSESPWGGSNIRMLTTPVGSATAVERARITRTGNLLVGTTSQLATNLTNTITKSQAPASNSTAWADQMSPLVVYGDFGNGSNDQGISSALTVVGWSSNGTGGAIMRGWWSTNGPSLGTPTLRFQVALNGNVTNANNSYGALSDARLKENVTDSTPKLDKLNQLRVVNFNLKGDKLKQIGLVAQEVEQIFPGMVEADSDDPDSMKSVKYSVLVPMLVKAVQELTARIAVLEGK